MRLTKLQYNYLARCKTYQADPPTIQRPLRLSWRAELTLAVIVGLGAWICFSMRLYWVGFVMAGMLVGALSRDVGTIIRAVKIWPALNYVVDWSRVDQVLTQSTADEKT